MGQIYASPNHYATNALVLIVNELGLDLDSREQIHKAFNRRTIDLIQRFYY
jgi:hypothetical protein